MIIEFLLLLLRKSSDIINLQVGFATKVYYSITYIGRKYVGISNDHGSTLVAQLASCGVHSLEQ